MNRALGFMLAGVACLLLHGCGREAESDGASARAVASFLAVHGLP